MKNPKHPHDCRCPECWLIVDRERHGDRPRDEFIALRFLIWWLLAVALIVSFYFACCFEGEFMPQSRSVGSVRHAYRRRKFSAVRLMYQRLREHGMSADRAHKLARSVVDGMEVRIISPHLTSAVRGRKGKVA